jgi:hypothetical protein
MYWNCLMMVPMWPKHVAQEKYIFVVSTVLANYLYFHCCLLIRCCGYLFTESLPNNERLL